MIVVSDTSPLNYLILTGYAHLLEALYGRVVIPRAVWDELRQPGAPAPVRAWVDALPEWVEVRGEGLRATAGREQPRAQYGVVPHDQHA